MTTHVIDNLHKQTTEKMTTTMSSITNVNTISPGQLQDLKREFDTQPGNSFTEQEFVNKFMGILSPDGTSTSTLEQQLTHLFMKIDANSDGTVDWDEFANFMFKYNTLSSVEGSSDTRKYAVDRGNKDSANKRSSRGLYMPVSGRTERGWNDSHAQTALTLKTTARPPNYVTTPIVQRSKRIERDDDREDGFHSDSDREESSKRVSVDILRRVYADGRERHETLAGMQLLAIYEAMNLQSNDADYSSGKQMMENRLENGKRVPGMFIPPPPASAKHPDTTSVMTKRLPRYIETTCTDYENSPISKRASLSARMRTNTLQHARQTDANLLNKHRESAARQIVRKIPESLQLTNKGLWAQEPPAQEHIPIYEKSFSPRLPDTSGHSDLIVASVFLPADYCAGFGYDRYVTADRSGIVCVWAVSRNGRKLRFRQAFRPGPHEIITMCYMLRAALLVVSTVAGEINFFEFSSLTGSVTPRGTISAPRLLHGMPVSLSYSIEWQDSERNSNNTKSHNAAGARVQPVTAEQRMLLEFGIDPAVCAEVFGTQDTSNISQHGQTRSSDRIGANVPTARHVASLPDGDEILWVGDDVGGLHKFIFSHKGWQIGTTLLNGSMISDNKAGRKNDTIDDTTEVIDAAGVTSVRQKKTSNSSYEYDIMKGIKIARFRAHEAGWINKVKLLADLGVLITACESGDIRIWDSQTMELISEYGNSRGVVDVAWSAVVNSLAFCTADRSVTLWNPFSRNRTAQLSGHTAPVVGVCFIEQHGHLVALCKDSSVKVWDAIHCRPIQHFRDENDKSNNNVLAESWCPIFHVHPFTNSIVTFDRTINLWPLEPKPGMISASSTRSAISTVLYNKTFSEILTIESSENSVSIWDVRSGDLLTRLTNIQAPSSLTAATLDLDERRLITGTNRGDELCICNFHNGGQKLSVLQIPKTTNNSSVTTSEFHVTSIVCIERIVPPMPGLGSAAVAKFVCAATADGRIFIFEDPASASGEDINDTNEYAAYDVDDSNATNSTKYDSSHKKLKGTKRHKQTIDEQLERAAGTILNSSQSNDFKQYGSDLGMRQTVGRARRLADKSVLSQRRRVAMRMAQQIRTDACEDHVVDSDDGEDVQDEYSFPSTSSLQQSSRSLSPRQKSAHMQSMAGIISMRRVRAVQKRLIRKQQKSLFNTFHLATGALRTSSLYGAGVRGEEAVNIAEKDVERSDSLFDNSSVLLDANSIDVVQPMHTLPVDEDKNMGHCHRDQITTMAFVPPHFLATCGQDGLVHLWSIVTGRWEKLIFAGKHRREATVQAARDAQIQRKELQDLACLTKKRQVLKHRSLNMTHNHTTPYHEFSNRDVTGEVHLKSPDLKFDNPTPPAESPSIIKRNRPNRAMALASKLDADRQVLRSAEVDKSLLKPEAPAIESIVYIRTLKCLAAAGEEKYIQLWLVDDPRHWQQYDAFLEENQYISAMNIDHASEILAVGDSCGTITLWDIVQHPSQRHFPESYTRLMSKQKDAAARTNVADSIPVKDSKHQFDSPNIHSYSTSIHTSGKDNLLSLHRSDTSTSLQYKHTIVGSQRRQYGTCAIAGCLRPLSRWNGFSDRAKITDIKFVESDEHDDVFVVASSTSGFIKMWNLVGELVGSFGTGRRWDINGIIPHPDVLNSSIIPFQKDSNASHLHLMSAELHHRAFIAEGGPDKYNASDEKQRPVTTEKKTKEMVSFSRIPIVGEVWIRINLYSGLQERRNIDHLFATTAPTAIDDLLQNHDWSQVTAMITVTRVTRDHIIGWNGMKEGKEKLWVPIHEFVSPDIRETNPWIKHIALSARVGRIFCTEIDDKATPAKPQRLAVSRASTRSETNPRLGSSESCVSVESSEHQTSVRNVSKQATDMDTHPEDLSPPFRVQCVYLHEVIHTMEDAGTDTSQVASERRTRVRDTSGTTWALPRLLQPPYATELDPDHPALSWLMHQVDDDRRILNNSSNKVNGQLMEALSTFLFQTVSSSPDPAQTTDKSHQHNFQMRKELNNWFACMPIDFPARHWFVYHPYFFHPRRSMTLHLRDDRLRKLWVAGATNCVNFWNSEIQPKLQTNSLPPIARTPSVSGCIPDAVLAVSHKLIVDTVQHMSHDSAISIQRQLKVCLTKAKSKLMRRNATAFSEIQQFCDDISNVCVQRNEDSNQFRPSPASSRTKNPNKPPFYSAMSADVTKTDEQIKPGLPDDSPENMKSIVSLHTILNRRMAINLERNGVFNLGQDSDMVGAVPSFPKKAPAADSSKSTDKNQKAHSLFKSGKEKTQSDNETNVPRLPLHTVSKTSFIPTKERTSSRSPVVNSDENTDDRGIDEGHKYESGKVQTRVNMTEVGPRARALRRMKRFRRVPGLVSLLAPEEKWGARVQAVYDRQRFLDQTVQSVRDALQSDTSVNVDEYISTGQGYASGSQTARMDIFNRTDPNIALASTRRTQRETNSEERTSPLQAADAGITGFAWSLNQRLHVPKGPGIRATIGVNDDEVDSSSDEESTGYAGAKSRRDSAQQNSFKFSDTQTSIRNSLMSPIRSTTGNESMVQSARIQNAGRATIESPSRRHRPARQLPFNLRILQRDTIAQDDIPTDYKKLLPKRTTLEERRMVVRQELRDILRGKA